MAGYENLKALLEAIRERLDAVKHGEFGPEGMSNLDDLTLSGGLTIGGVLTAASTTLTGAIAAASLSTTGAAAVGGALTANSLALTTPLPNNQLATPNGQFVISFYSAGGQTTGVKKDAALLPMACTLVGVRAYLDTAPTTASFIIDANKNGTTVFTTQGNRPTILSAANASSTTAPEVTAFAAGDRFSYDIDQIGSGTPGSDLYVVALFKATLVA